MSSKQQKNTIRKKVYSILTLIVLLLIFLFFLSFSIRNATICTNINSRNLKEYSGSYNISISHRARNTIYYVSLENGDMVQITPELLKNGSDFSEHPVIHFVYSEPRFGLPSGYTCVGIYSTNNSECYMEIEDSLGNAKIGMYIGITFSIITFALAVLLFVSYLTAYHFKKK